MRMRFDMRHRRALEIDLVEKAIHLPRGDALAPLVGNLLHQLQHPLDVLALRRRDKDHRRIVEILQHVSQLRLEDLAIRGGLPSVRPVVTRSHLFTTMITQRPLSCA